jgi:hypothetical protein
VVIVEPVRTRGDEGDATSHDSEVSGNAGLTIMATKSN